MENKLIVGRRELISIVDLELFDLDAKVDTGADSNALHCDDIVVDEVKNEVSFTLLDEVHEAYRERWMVRHWTRNMQAKRPDRSGSIAR